MNATIEIVPSVFDRIRKTIWDNVRRH